MVDFSQYTCLLEEYIVRYLREISFRFVKTVVGSLLSRLLTV